MEKKLSLWSLIDASYMNKKQILIFLIVSTLTMFLALIANSQSQPIVVLEYPNFTNNSQIILIMFLFKIMIIQQLTK